ncbi:MAG: hypothetical protein A2700_02730 [Candidatus Blackburnbacteria bacterium RIFCSPHIGHO2_01_FULL_44_64]|uniref:Glycosyltransferase RgtA/B/C/D-like domain-containing protein n=1 Tax=Candidatus Blackburnbacteria bacterium RIFCSPHIGHO2_02_FULL_44_20 TaxID=1797516 RepID=A0A1G1V9G7_9BACT|nr:MAG: hypothetical protein A2700_02730 [Candidatus Blackburnbacteria bacterium RIFCSPHIGHO2_01_FULL_44_64]OGY11698.1 MAG: hypothetical protein A3E16_00925 [Candidatus Blackburnbacteria bacterium RIFCSPHIGHO2_12_FULL_44_25]OGY11957.1 MAG: hypothetical protein A3D26_03130 [Candidatus Blackburnbacteria bacterium RIFCSPHIGHO2_02_FULL_44_20]OGY14517.1 MAG: hypothetical protein A3A62_02280 [Candidatus Blackburnbacteria bacterium RIFCSPLOWO2_01_FULL_44_43]OGY15963.1 MAG: hypothetical protein A3H88_0
MNKLLAIVFVVSLVFILYHPALKTFFSQDDFFHFRVSQTDGTLGGFLSLFGFHSFEERKIAFYRPITRELPFNLSYAFFGLNPAPLRILSFLLLFANTYMVYLLIAKLFKNKTIGFFTSLFFATTSNTAALYYLAGGIQTIGATFFILLTLLLFDRYLETGNKKIKVLSFFTFLLALGSEEQSVILPVLLAGLIFIQSSFKESIKKSLLELWPHILVVCVFTWADINLIGFSKEETQYHFDFSIKKLANTFSWYLVWAFGLPEMLIDFVLPGLKLNPSLMRYWPHFYKPIFLSFFISAAVLIAATIYSGSKNIFKSRILWLLIVWFTTGLVPVLFLPQHKSTHYLQPVLPAFWGAIIFLTFSAYENLKSKAPKLSALLAGFFAGGILSLSFFSSLAGKELYWAASRGRLAKKLISDISYEFPKLPQGAVLYIQNDPSYPFVAKDWGGTSKQAAFVLNNVDGLRLYYKDPSLKVYYQDTIPPTEVIPESAYTVVAKIDW